MSPTFRHKQTLHDTACDQYRSTWAQTLRNSQSLVSHDCLQNLDGSPLPQEEGIISLSSHSLTDPMLLTGSSLRSLSPIFPRLPSPSSTVQTRFPQHAYLMKTGRMRTRPCTSMLCGGAVEQREGLSSLLGVFS